MTDRALLLAVDPGKLSGFVLLDTTEIPDGDPKIVLAEEFDQQLTAANMHWWLASGEVTSVVMEDFFITVETAKKKDTRYSLELLGVGRYFSTLYSVPFTLQSPSAAKSFVDNDRIRALGLWVRGGEGHHKDAMRHAILHLVKDCDWRPDKLLSS